MIYIFQSTLSYDAGDTPKATAVTKDIGANYEIAYESWECERVRDHLVQIAATKISAGVSTGIGGHVEEIEEKGDDQFEISDGRSVKEVYDALLTNHLQPVMSDYIYV